MTPAPKVNCDQNGPHTYLREYAQTGLLFALQL